MDKKTPTEGNPVGVIGHLSQWQFAADSTAI